VEQLVNRSYVIRNVDLRDRRRSSLQLSAAGLAAHQKIEAVINAVEAQVLSQLDPMEVKALSAVLTHLNDNCARLLEETHDAVLFS
jgi:DNA-binding MarR family transcriptional regulator